MLMQPCLTLVVPILNEAETLSELLAAIKSQTLRPNEIIFCDAGSSDGGPALIDAWWQQQSWGGASCRVVSLPGAMPGAGRNAGISLSQNEWISFVDGGICPEPGWLEALYEHATTRRSVAVFGICQFSAGCAFSKSVCALSYGQGSVHPVIPASLFHKEVFASIGGFPEGLRAGEDLIWVERLIRHYGGREICKDARVHYTHFPETWSRAFRKWRITEYYCAAAGIRTRQHLGYLIVLPALYVTIIFGGWVGATLGMCYLAARGYVDPARRSAERPWWGDHPAALVIAMALAPTLDFAKLVGIMQGFGHRLLVALGMLSPLSNKQF